MPSMTRAPKPPPRRNMPRKPAVGNAASEGRTGKSPGRMRFDAPRGNPRKWPMPRLPLTPPRGPRPTSGPLIGLPSPQKAPKPGYKV